MSAFKKKTLTSDCRAIKLGIILTLTLFGGSFLFTEPVLATSEFFEESFNYDVGDIAGQGYWKQLTGLNSFHISTTTAQAGFKSLAYDLSSFGNGNLKDGVGIANSTDGAFIFYFKLTTDITNQKIFFSLTNDNVLTAPERYDNSLLTIEINSNLPTPEIILSGKNTTSTPIAITTPLNIWNKIELEYNCITHLARAKLWGSFWSDYIPLRNDISSINSYFFEGGDTANPFYVDNIQWTTGEIYTPPCDFGEGCQFCNSSTTCALVNCIWYDDFCWNTPPPDLPDLEDCSGLTITERLLCEIKNFFYRLFVPSQEKITELRSSVDLVKNKFPYSYILEFKNFFSYLKDNINDEQGINFSILGQSASLNFGFWNTTTTIAGSEQTIKDIIQKVFGFIILLGFGFWCFNFIKRIFR